MMTILMFLMYMYNGSVDQATGDLNLHLFGADSWPVVVICIWPAGNADAAAGLLLFMNAKPLLFIPNGLSISMKVTLDGWELLF